MVRDTGQHPVSNQFEPDVGLRPRAGPIPAGATHYHRPFSPVFATGLRHCDLNADGVVNVLDVQLAAAKKRLVGNFPGRFAATRVGLHHGSCYRNRWYGKILTSPTSDAARPDAKGHGARWSKNATEEK